MVDLVRHDLEFILRQIKISEAHAAGTPLTQIRVDAAGNPIDENHPDYANAVLAISNPLLPYGLRTVDGSYNNLAPGREEWGASDQEFPNLLTLQYRNEGDDSFLPVTTNNDYAIEGNVADADPRLISNLIVDQTINNPAAVSAGLTAAGLSGAALTNALNAFNAAATDEAKIDLLEGYGVTVDAETKTIFLANVAPDEGLSAPYNSWFTLFGQFFDHGLDLVKKGGSGTVFIPLQPDDPLYVEGSHTNFMALTRVDQDAPVNLTTPFVDQNQTYTSHASHQVFLREYALDGDERPIATGKLLEGARGLATWADVKAQALEYLGIELTDADVVSVPLVRTDQYGKFIPDPLTGFAQLIVGVGADGIPNTDDDDVISGTPDNPVGTATALRTMHAFLDDIAHSAVPQFTDGVLDPTKYDAALLDAHYTTGDGRGNENIGLSAVHHIFHSEHNRLVEQIKEEALSSGDAAFLSEWLLEPVTEIPGDLSGLQWNGERLFQAARFTNEMQYQHLVFEEFARKVQPDIDAFVFNASLDINPAIFAEFAHVVYRFGHSMLNQTVDRINADGTRDDLTLFEAFLNPLAFGSETVDHHVAAGAIVRGMTSQVGNEIDEFVTHVLRNQLVGIPLDLAAINIARGRDTGIPPLNEARRQFQEMANGDTQLAPYTSWVDFALNLKNSASIVNFIAAYGTHETITSATTVEGKREAAMNLVFGGPGTPEDRLAFLNGQGAYASDLGGLEYVDLWVGGLAEKKMAFGGMLGSTFSFVFELQLENLQNGDRFYYLSRVQGLNLLNELENNSLAKMVRNNTDLGETGYALPGDIFSVPDHVLYVDKNKQEMFGHEDPEHDDPILAAISDMIERVDANNDGIAEYLRVNSNDHFVIQGTDGDDWIVAGGGDDTVWGGDGNDRIEAGYGVDIILGGKGDDIITNSGTDIGETDLLHGEEGNDVIHGGSGLALIFGNQGQDAIFAGPDGKEVFGGTGNDFILGGAGGDFLLGNEGDDWIEGAGGFDVIAGDNSELFFNSTIIGHDVMFAGSDEQDFDAESGDDIMVQGESVIRNEGMFGFDWSIFKGVSIAANADLQVRIFTTDEQDILRNRFDQVEALSGWHMDDVLRGDSRTNVNNDDGAAETRLDNNELTQAGVNRIAGLREMLGDFIAPAPVGPDIDLESIIAFDGGNILLGGGGSDWLEGRGGNDFIDGHAWLNVRISVRDLEDPSLEIMTVDSLAQLQGQLLSRAINPGQLHIVREILYADTPGAIDTAVFSDVFANYDISISLDGIWTVAHDGGAGADGTDTLRNIDRVRFADGFYAPSNGAITIDDTTPTEGQTLTATVYDPNGVVGTPTIRWEAETAPGVWTQVGLGAQFTPGQNQVGLRLRAVATYQDGLEVIDTVTSTETGVVGDLFVGTNGVDVFAGTAGDDNAQGLGGNDTLLGNAGDDLLDGGGGNDTLEGGDGNDTLIGGAGADILRGGAGNDQLYGDAGNDTLEGGDGDDLLDGGAGNDAMAGGAGDDTYVVNAGGDSVVEAPGAGTDTVLSSVTYALAANVENLTLTGTGNINGTGNELDNLLTGNTGNNTLDGGAGADTLIGGAGNDTLLGGAGSDMLDGGDGNDLLDGGAGGDAMAGGAGDDTYVVDEAGDTVTEAAGEGIDTVLSSVSYVLGPNVENLTLTGTGNIDGTGNELANTITGNGGDNVLNGGDGNDTLNGGAGNDTLIGGAGDDTMIGGAGDDTFYVDSAGDTVSGDAGTDTVYATVSYTLATGVENLTLLGSDDLSGTGNGASNVLIGNSGNNTLDGGAGSDTMAGGAGDDTYVVNAAGDSVVEAPDEGTDTVLSSVTYALAANVENLILTGAGNINGTGNELANVLTGNTGNNTLNGGQGADTMIGGLGNDTYVVDDAADVVIELAGEGTDLVEASVSHALSANVENLTLIGVGNIDGTGNELANSIIGNGGDNVLDGGDGNDTLIGGAGNDTLIGGAGDDTMIGGAGDDIFYVDSAGDSVNGGAGIDTVFASVSHILAAGAENLTLLGSDDLAGTGNGSSNILIGNSGNNVLNANGGADTLDGGAGDDILIGGTGNDVFVFGPGSGNDSIVDFDANPAAGQDMLDITAYGITDFSTEVSIALVSGSTVVSIGGDSITLLAVNGIGANAITIDDFIV